VITPKLGDARHPLHCGERIWPESNCYIDLWIGLLHSAQLDPIPMLVCGLGSRFDVDQWTFCKPAGPELASLYQVRVEELNPWWSLPEHIARQVACGRVILVEADGFFLPDTSGTTYHRTHGKTTIGIHRIDRDTRELHYLHNTGAWTLRDDDFDGLFSTGVTGAGLPPFVEFADLSLAMAFEDVVLRDRAAALARARLTMVATENPFERWADLVESQLDALATHEIEFFHAWAFGTMRQAGSTAELLGRWSNWMGTSDTWRRAAVLFLDVAQSLAAQQFRLARVPGGGRRPDLAAALRANAPRWHDAHALVHDAVHPTVLADVPSHRSKSEYVVGD
jgi:hypothetical protein